jgi:two-component system response regulator RegX3
MHDAVRVLVVEDEILCRDMLAAGLTREGYDVDVAKDGIEGLGKFTANRPDIVLLDMVLPDISGTEVCRRIRAEASVPVIVVSGLGAEDDVVLALETGAADYVTKPYRLSDLTARMQAVLRRVAPPLAAVDQVDSPRQCDVIGAGAVCMDLVRREVTTSGRRVHLTRREFDLLALLLSPPNRMRTREELVDHLWSGRDLDNSRALDAHVRRLRVKLEDGLAGRRHLVTVRGVGFRFDTVGGDVHDPAPLANPAPLEIREPAFSTTPTDGGDGSRFQGLTSDRPSTDPARARTPART